MKRFKLTVAYDGTTYCGYQYQPELPTIEGTVNDALSGLLREDIVTIGASRTDAGVHAYGNVAVFLQKNWLLHSIQSFLTVSG